MACKKESYVKQNLIGSSVLGENSLLKFKKAPKLIFRNTRIEAMSESSFYCSICSKGHFLNLLQAVMHVISETAKGKGSRHVPCCVQGCLETVRKFKLRLHIRKSHGELCTLSCSVCQAKFVEQRDLDNHLRNGCPRTVWKRRIGKHKAM